MGKDLLDDGGWPAVDSGPESGRRSEGDGWEKRGSATGAFMRAGGVICHNGGSVIDLQ